MSNLKAGHLYYYIDFHRIQFRVTLPCYMWTCDEAVHHDGGQETERKRNRYAPNGIFYFKYVLPL
jgi:hypothetical protein